MADLSAYAALAGVPARPAASEAGLRAAVQFTPAEQAASDAKESSSGNIRELEDALSDRGNYSGKGRVDPRQKTELQAELMRLKGAPVGDPMSKYAAFAGVDSAPARDVDISVRAPDAKAQGPEAIPVNPGANTTPTPQPEESAWDKIKGVGQAAQGVISSGIAAPIAGVAGAVKSMMGGDGDKFAGEITEKLLRGNPRTQQPLTPTAERYLGNVGDATSWMTAFGPHVELQTLGHGGAATGRAAADRTMGGMAAAFEDKKAPRIEPTLEKPRYKLVDGKPVEVAQDAAKSAPIVNDEARAKPDFDSAPVVGGVDPSLSNDRAALLKRIGLADARQSAIDGDAMAAATEHQISKVDEPAGQASKAMFGKEREALTNHANSVVDRTGGTRGVEEEARHERGQTIATPLDEYRDWFKQSKAELYKEAERRSEGKPMVATDPVDKILTNPDFLNSAMADDQSHLIQGIQKQWDLHKERNPDGLTVSNVEEFNKFVNKRWTPKNAGFIADIRAAADEAVTKSAGEDLFEKGRQIHRLEKQTLDSPDGISKLIGADPSNPINRVTPHEKIPDAIARQPIAQFKNTLDTYKGMPTELQPKAQAAIGEIKAHLVNKLIEAGNSDKGAWNAKKAETFAKANSAKLRIAFEDDPKALSMIADLVSAGKVLQVDASYPGAAAQAANLMKRGMLSSLAGKSMTGAGALAGSLAGPMGSAAGAAIGEAAGSKMAGAMAEKSALKKFNKGLVSLRDIAP